MSKNAAQKVIDELEPATIEQSPPFSLEWEPVILGNSERTHDVVRFNHNGVEYLASRNFLQLLAGRGLLTLPGTMQMAGEPGAA